MIIRRLGNILSIPIAMVFHFIFYFININTKEDNPEKAPRDLYYKISLIQITLFKLKDENRVFLVQCLVLVLDLLFFPVVVTFNGYLSTFYNKLRRNCITYQ